MALTYLFFNIKQDYIYLNPVRVGLGEKEEDLYSSCEAVYGIKKGIVGTVNFA